MNSSAGTLTTLRRESRCKPSILALQWSQESDEGAGSRSGSPSPEILGRPERHYIVHESLHYECMPDAIVLGSQNVTTGYNRL